MKTNKTVNKRNFVRRVNQAHSLIRFRSIYSYHDWQEPKFVLFHEDLISNETEMSAKEASRIVSGISNKWGLRIEQLYPQKQSNHGYSWGCTLGPRHGVVWLDSDMFYPSYLLHEIAHVVLECFKNYDLGGKSNIREEGHGILFCSILYHWLIDYYKGDTEILKKIDMLVEKYKLCMAEPESYLEMEKLFKNKTLI